MRSVGWMVAARSSGCNDIPFASSKHAGETLGNHLVFHQSAGSLLVADICEDMIYLTQGVIVMILMLRLSLLTCESRQSWLRAL